MAEPALLRWDEMTGPKAAPAYFVTCTESDMDNHAAEQSSDAPNCLTRIIRGRQCPTKERLFQEWAAALQFPYYFGQNWDAFEECINDLEWLPAPAYVVVLTNIEDVLVGQVEDFSVYMKLLRSAAEEWGSRKTPVPFRAVFHCRIKNELSAQSRLETAGVNLEMRRVRYFARSGEPET